jgi:uncharacterized Zn-binding protein involved in type VI secretion
VPVTVNINGLSAVHQGSDGMATATAPNVCLTPGPSGPVPVPYPNIAMSSDLVGGTTTVTIDGSPAAIQGSKFVKSTGDQAGSAGGVVSGVFGMEATFISFSPTVMIEGKPACRLTDKMLMNKANTVCMSGEQQCSISAADPTSQSSDQLQTINPEAPKQCVLRSVLVQCGHDKRNLQIDLAKGDVHVIKVISKSNEPDKVVVEWDGSCGFAHSYCPSVGVVDERQVFTAIDRSSGTAEMPIPGFLIARDPLWALRTLIFSHEIPHADRTLTSRLCLGHAAADVCANQWIKVQVFPELRVKADMILGYSRKNAQDSDGHSKPLVYDEKTTWIISGGIDATYGANKLKFDASASMEAVPMFGPLLKNVGWLTTVFDSMASRGLDVKLTERWPKWKVAGSEVKLIELTGKPDVGPDGTFEVGFDPLFGIELEVSILDWLIRFLGDLAGFPGAMLAEALVLVRKRFAEGGSILGGAVQTSLDINIVLTVGGTIKGGFGVKFTEGKSDVDPETTGIDGSVDIKVEGRVVGKGRIWKFAMLGAGKVGSSSAGSTSEPSKIGGKVTPDNASKKPFATKGQIYFNGLAFYYLLYIEVGAGGADSKKATSDDTSESAVDFGGSSKTTLVERKGTAVLLHPWSWPKESGSAE